MYIPRTLLHCSFKVAVHPKLNLHVCLRHVVLFIHLSESSSFGDLTVDCRNVWLLPALPLMCQKRAILKNSAEMSFFGRHALVIQEKNPQT